MLMTNDYSGPCGSLLRHPGTARLVGGGDPVGRFRRLARTGEREGELIPGAVPTLEHLAGRGYQLSLLSNIWTAYLRAVRRLLGDFFEEQYAPELQLFSCREGLVKPRRGLFDRLLEPGGRGFRNVRS